MKTATGGLKKLLDLTSRKQFVNGKPQQQVIACILRPSEDGADCITTSLVRDGKTSLARFSIGAEWGSDEEGIVIPDIERLVGVLSAHSGEVNLTHTSDGIGKLKVKSGKKQTTLTAEAGGLAFPHSNETIGQWEEKSLGLSAQITEGGYSMRDGSLREPFFTASLPCSELWSALHCDHINSQKLNRYTFRYEGHNLSLDVGDHLKGQTNIHLLEYDSESNVEDWESTFEGGLENIVSQYSGEAHLHFLDFRPEGQGIRLIVRFDNGDWVYQASVLKRA